MSIQSQIDRISNNVANAKSAIAKKGVVVSSNKTSDDLYDLIMAIKSVSDNVFIVHASTQTDKADSSYSRIEAIANGDGVPLGGYTVGEDVLNGDDVSRYVFLIMEDSGTSDPYNGVRLGALSEIDSQNETASFAIGANTAVIDNEQNLTIE